MAGRAARAGLLLLVASGLACATTAGPTATPRASSTDAPERSARQLLVILKAAPPPVWNAAARDLAASLGLEVIASWPIAALDAPCVVFEATTEREAARLVSRLAVDPRVAAAERNQTFETLTESAHRDPYAHLQPGARALRLEAAHRVATGRGVRIGLIDTGVDIAHPDLKARIQFAKSFLAEGEESFTGDLHGTAVAGVLAAVADNGEGIFGAAPEAEIYALKACWPESPGERRARCNSYTLARALDFALDAQVQILNLSLAGPSDPLLESLVRAALARGVVVVAAQPPDGETGFPASLPGVIAVTAADLERDGAATAPRPVPGRLAAPGEEVLTTAPRDSYDFFSGSSIATAFVTGTVALLLEHHPELRPERIAAILHHSSRPVAASGLAGAATLELLDPCAALAEVDGRARCE